MKFLICSVAIFVVLVSAQDTTDCGKQATQDTCCKLDTCRWGSCLNGTVATTNSCIALTDYNETLCNHTCPTEPHTTDSPGNETTAVPRHTTVKPMPPCQQARFNAASFIGGIVLCAGVVAIVLFACKFYQSRQEQNYHTL